MKGGNSSIKIVTLTMHVELGFTAAKVGLANRAEWRGLRGRDVSIYK